MKPTYLAVCERCYTAVLATSSKKRDVERVATSHISAYGHNVSVLTDRNDAKQGQCPECERSNGPHYRGRCTH